MDVKMADKPPVHSWTGAAAFFLFFSVLQHIPPRCCRMPTQTHSQAMTGSTMPREAHRPYRFGMTLLCFGGLLNWVGLFENYTEPVRYIGVTCVVSGAILLCFAICCWLRPGAHRENAWGQAHPHANPALVRTAKSRRTAEHATAKISCS